MLRLLEMCWNCIDSPEQAAQRRKNEEIDKRIMADNKVDQRIVKLLLLGSGESGKSTFIKQLRIIKGKGFDSENRLSYTTTIRSNLIQSVKSILKAMSTLYIECATEEAEEAKKKVLNMLSTLPDTQYDEVCSITHKQLDPIADSIVTLWADEGFQKCFSRRKEFQLLDSAQYYLDKAEQICKSDFIPTNQDILRSREKTTSITEYIFDIKKVQLKVIDVGGQRKERRKWISCFDNITSIIFLSSLSDYDLQLQETFFESNQTNRMRESLELFGTIIKYPWFQQKSIILFLNKTDLFEEKIMSSNIRDYFPQYRGKPGDATAGMEFIREMYEEKKPPSLEGPESTHIFPHFTCATDTDNISKVFKDVQEIILKSYLDEFNLI